MSNVARVAGQAANTLSKPLDVDEVFSTYLYEGSNTLPLVQTTGIDGSEGALVWIKQRNAARQHILFDTEQDTNLDSSNTRAGQTSHDTTITSTGFSLNNGDAKYNDGTTPGEYVSWTFRKSPKFFDVVTYTGDGSSNRSVSHNLGSTPGCIIIKRTDATQDWFVAARNNSGSYYYDLNLNTTDAAQGPFDFVGSASYTMDDSAFALDIDGVSNYTNISGATYVAYLWAHNDGDGEFGPDADQDIIKCGSFTGGSSTAIDLGWEPQWVMIKRTDSSTGGDWYIYDTMRGLTSNSGTSGDSNYIFPSSINAEAAGGNRIQLKSYGFDSSANLFSAPYIYIAIRRGPLAPPTSATDVFDVAPRTANAPGHKSGFVTDMFFRKNSTSSSNWFGSDRLRQGRFTYMNDTTAEAGASNFQFDYMNGVTTDTTATSTLYAWMWKRAPNFCDIVAYTGDGQIGRTVSHNLGVVPEMIWVKRRSGTGTWQVYHKNSATNGEGRLELNNTSAVNTSNVAYVWGNNTSYVPPTSSVFTISNPDDLNASGSTYIAYLFASLDGISKVGSYTGNGGASQDIDCGFTSGARFVMVKAASGTGDWWIWDTERGITAGNDSSMRLNTADAAVTTLDFINPLSSGFTVVGSDSSRNGSGIEYIFYAIA